MARYSQVEVDLEACTRSEGICGASVGLGNVTRRAGRCALGDDRVLIRCFHLDQRGLALGGVQHVRANVEGARARDYHCAFAAVDFQTRAAGVEGDGRDLYRNLDARF